MKQVTINTHNDNPFYGLKACLNLFQNMDKHITSDMLNKAYFEVKGNKEHTEMFFSLLFSIGDITARQHNVFKGKKKDNGGTANREGFYTILQWMIKNHYTQFVKFLNEGLFNEFTCFDHLFRSRVKTKGKQVVTVYDMFADAHYRTDLATYLYSVINGSNSFNKYLVAKFLTLPRLSKRSKSKKMLDETLQVMENKVRFLVELSELMGWDYEVKGKYTNFRGYREWRKEYNSELESVLFSSGKINELDKLTFIDWLDKLPAQARFRVRNRIMFEKEGVFKYPNHREWFTEWEFLKEQKQAEQRKLEEKIRQGVATQEDELKLKEVKKEAKVTTGAVNFTNIFKEIVKGSVDKLKVQPFLDKINLPYNTLVFVDDSGSMMGGWGSSTRDFGFTPFEFATFMATICLTKNPDDVGRSLLGLYSADCRLYTSIDQVVTAPNSLLRGTAQKTYKPFIDGNLHFLENMARIRNFCMSKRTGNGTDIVSIPRYLKKHLGNNPEAMEQLMQFPVWTIISDGNWNNAYSPEGSVNEFFKNCEIHLGFKPFVIAIDVAHTSSAVIERFSGIENFMFIPPNPAQIEQFLTNFNDMDIFDVYTPLQSLHRSNRYELVRLHTIL